MHAPLKAAIQGLRSLLTPSVDGSDGGLGAFQRVPVHRRQLHRAVVRFSQTREWAWLKSTLDVSVIKISRLFPVRGTGDVELEFGQDSIQPALGEVTKNERRIIRA